MFSECICGDGTFQWRFIRSSATANCLIGLCDILQNIKYFWQQTSNTRYTGCDKYNISKESANCSKTTYSNHKILHADYTATHSFFCCAEFITICTKLAKLLF